MKYLEPQGGECKLPFCIYAAPSCGKTEAKKRITAAGLRVADSDDILNDNMTGYRWDKSSISYQDRMEFVRTWIQTRPYDLDHVLTNLPDLWHVTESCYFMRASLADMWDLVQKRGPGHHGMPSHETVERWYKGLLGWHQAHPGVPVRYLKAGQYLAHYLITEYHETSEYREQQVRAFWESQWRTKDPNL